MVAIFGIADHDYLHFIFLLKNDAHDVLQLAFGALPDGMN